MVLEELLSRDDLPAPVRALIRAEIDRSSSAAARHEHTEKALAASRLLYRDLFDSIADPIFIFDAATYHFLDVNVAALERYGYSLDELKRMVPQQLHPSKELQLVKSRLSDGDELPHDYTHVTKGGEAFPVEIHTGSVIYEGKESYISIARDVSERLKLEEHRRGIAALRGQKLESLGLLASGLAHDLNNLLAGILGHNDLALSQLASHHPARSNIERAMQGAEGAADLARQMLAYSGRGHLNILATDLSVLVQENVSLLQAGLPKQVQLNTELSEKPTFVDADAGQMQRLIMNLAINGAEAIGDRAGQVAISTGFETVIAGDDRYSRFTAMDLSAGPHVFLEVRDDGDGMDEEALAKVFDPFFTTKLEGRGLGLAALLGIVRGHAGGIDVQSKRGVGTTFRLVFPLAEEASQETLSVEPQGNLEGTILVIDDEKAVLNMVEQMLSMEGLKVLTAASGADGLAIYREMCAEVRLVVLDYSMPGMNGKETLRELRRITPDIPIVLCSGFGVEEVTARFDGLAVTGFVQKPYRLATMIAEVRNCLVRPKVSDGARLDTR